MSRDDLSELERRTAEQIRVLEEQVADLRNVINEIRDQLIQRDDVTWINAPMDRDSYEP